MTSHQSSILCGTKTQQAGCDPFTYIMRFNEIRDSGAWVWYADDGAKWIVVFEKSNFEYWPKPDLLKEGTMKKQKNGFTKLMTRIAEIKQ